jgi:aspartate racemase
MKLLGLIGGTSPESTAIYYRLLNQFARRRAGGVHSARLVLWSFDYHLIDSAYKASDWERYRALVVEAGHALKRAGAQALMICSNTTHLAAAAVREATGLPLIHIVDVLAAALERARSKAPLLLGTPFVMSGDFYRSDLRTRFAQETLVPDARGQDDLYRMIFDELVRGEVSPASQRRLLEIIAEGRGAGADGVILGCTELSLILDQSDTELPVFDTTSLHAQAAIEHAFGPN